MAAAIVILLIAWYFCKLRRAGDVHFSVLFQISFSESKRRKCVWGGGRDGEHRAKSLRVEIFL